MYPRSSDGDPEESAHPESGKDVEPITRPRIGAGACSCTSRLRHKRERKLEEATTNRIASASARRRRAIRERAHHSIARSSAVSAWPEEAGSRE